MALESSTMPKALTVGIAILVAIFTLGIFANLAFQAFIYFAAPGETPLTLLTRAEVPHTQPSSGAAIVSAGFETASVVATSLSQGARTLLGWGSVAGALTTLTIGVVGCIFLVRIARGNPFGDVLVWATIAAGFALTSGAILSQGLTGLGQMVAADELNPSANDVFIAGFTGDVTPVVVGIALLALTSALNLAGRMQRDTRGLV